MEPTGESPHGQPDRSGILIALGAGGMLVAMATDAIAVLGRHVGFTFPGAIEIFQLAAVIAISSAILLASLGDRHAAVDLLVGRAGESTKRRLTTIGKLALATAFGTLCAGSIWVAADLWSTSEMTELLAIPIRPFRLAWILSCAAAAIHFTIAFVKSLRA